MKALSAVGLRCLNVSSKVQPLEIWLLDGVEVIKYSILSRGG